jgi:CHAD domain-containing protein
MHKSHTLASLLDHQVSTLRARLEGVYDGGADAVHDARVATRRIRELLALVPVVPGREGGEDTAKGLKGIGRALGRVRDIDVQLTLITGLQDHTAQAAPALVIVRQDYESERLAKTRKLIKTLERLEVDRLLEAVAANHPAGLRKRLTSNGWRHQLDRLVAERARNAAAALVHATGVYFPKRAHMARIAVKQLRYAAEIAEATGLTAVQPALKALRKGQEILGDLHDRQALADTLQHYAKHDAVKAAHVELAGQVLEREVMQLHAAYLARRAALRNACAEVEHAASRAWRATPVLVAGTAALAVTGILYGRHALAARAIES